MFCLINLLDSKNWYQSIQFFFHVFTCFIGDHWCIKRGTTSRSRKMWSMNFRIYKKNNILPSFSSYNLFYCVYLQLCLIILCVFECSDLCSLWDYLYVDVYGCVFVFVTSNNLIGFSYQAMSDENPISK